jgi:hypothetical protein
MTRAAKKLRRNSATTVLNRSEKKLLQLLTNASENISLFQSVTEISYNKKAGQPVRTNQYSLILVADLARNTK